MSKPPIDRDVGPTWVKDMDRLCGRKGEITVLIGKDVRIHIPRFERDFQWDRKWFEVIYE